MSVICFSESPAYITEDDGSATITLFLTNPSSSDVTAIITTSDETAIGTYVC